ncbi:MAG: hypothetical protein HY784_14840 [Chloroflexi bacterium]|nr:hypothetical protein [Chloroflexota bacterium]
MIHKVSRLIASGSATTSASLAYSHQPCEAINPTAAAAPAWELPVTRAATAYISPTPAAPVRTSSACRGSKIRPG